jgi:TPR repeat protein
MKSLGKISVIVVSTALICGAAAFRWHFVKARASARWLAQDTDVCRARAENGDASAQYELAGLYYQGKGVPQDYKAAAVWYRKAADQGNPKAQYGVGYMYEQGKGLPQDHAQALQWYRKSADQGYAIAQYDIGYSYYEGKGVPLDYSEAARWFRKGADQGYAKAQDGLGYMYSQGKGVSQDDKEAAAWYRKAADQGFARAQDDLGYLYSQGKGVPRDYAQAARWFRKAAKQGDEYARSALDSMNTRLTAASKVMLSITFLGSILLLINTRESIRKQQHQRAALAGALGLLWVGADVYGHSHFGIFLSLSAVNAFSFCKGFLGGISVAMLFSVAWPQRIKIVLSACGVLIIAFNFYAISHFHLRHFADCSRALYSINALLIGIAVTMAILLWLNGEATKGNQSGNDGVATGTEGTIHQPDFGH